MRISPLGLVGLLSVALSGCAYLPTSPKSTALSEGVAVSISGSAGSVKYFTFVVPFDAPGLRVDVSGGSGDANLYLRHGARPNDALRDCASTLAGNVDECEIPSPVAGTWHIAVVGYEAYANVELVADIVTPTVVASPAPGAR